VGIFFGTRIYVDYNRTISTAEERLLTQTRVIDENIATNLTVVNLLLNDIATKMKDTSGGSQLNNYLKKQLVMTPGIRTLIITNSQGRCIHSNRDELLGKDFPKDRDYFKIPRDTPDKEMLFLSPPYTTILGKYSINITKPLTGEHHDFNGIVSVTFDPEYFSALLSSTIYTPDNRVSLVHGDGTVFMAVPEAKIPVTGIKVTQPGSAFHQHISGGTPTSIRTAAGKTVGDKRIFAYCTNIPKGVRFDRQIIIAASRNQYEVLAVWWMDTGIELGIFLLFASLSIVTTRVMLQRGIELKRLEETRAHLASIVEFSDDAIISKDMNGVILSWNSGAERLFAYPPDEAIGQPITMLIPPELLDEEKTILQNLKAGELVKHFETVRIAKDGRQIEVSVTSSPLKDTIGQVVGASKIIRDISERKLAEKKLQESQDHLQTAYEDLEVQNEELQMQREELQTQGEELQAQGEELGQLLEKSSQAEALLRSVTDSISDPLFLKDRSCRLLLANAATLVVLDKRIEDVIGKSDEEIYDDPAIGRLMMANDLRVMESGQTEIIEEIVPGPYGNRTFLSSKTPYRDDAGRVIGIIGIARDITDRKRSEEALRESEFFFKESQRAASIGSYKTDFISGKWESSEILDTIFGIDSEYIRSIQGWLDLVHPDDRDMMDQYLREEVIAKRICFSKEYRIIRKHDGETRWVHGLGKVAYDHNDSPISLIGTIQDITVRIRTHEMLRLSEERLRLAQDVAGIGTWEWSPKTGTTIWSPEIERLHGVAPGALTTYQDWQKLVHPEDIARVEAETNEALTNRSRLDMEFRIIRPSGELRWVVTLGGAIYDDSGEVVRAFGVNMDITERKQAEEALRKIHAELELRIEERTSDLTKVVRILENEILVRRKAELNLQRLNLLYSVLGETNQTIVKINDRDSLFRDFCRIAVEHGGFVLSWIGLVDGQSGKVNIVASSGATDYLNDISITTKNEPEGEGPTGISIRDGSYYICNDFQNDPCTRPWHDQGKKYGICASASIAIKENDQVVGALTLYGGEKDYFDVQQVKLLIQMGMDISFALDNLNRENSHKEAEKALYEETSERLKTVETLREKEQMLIQQSRQAAMGEMIGNIAHQWRQPLNILGLYTQQLGVFYGSPNFNKEFLDTSIAKSMEIIKHMSKTIDDFRGYFKPEKEKIDFYVNAAIKSTLSLLEGNFQTPKITIDFVEHGKPIINGYQNEFAQVFLNILNNARDAIIERGINNARVTITICNEDNCAVVTVVDNAGGIPDEIINKVFDPYFTTKGPQVGTGIGLFMSKTIIEKNMGGRLTVRNTDAGAEFRIEVEYGTQN
jgi:PAS domain S-box-containing protein